MVALLTGICKMLWYCTCKDASATLTDTQSYRILVCRPKKFIRVRVKSSRRGDIAKDICNALRRKLQLSRRWPLLRHKHHVPAVFLGESPPLCKLVVQNIEYESVLHILCPCFCCLHDHFSNDCIPQHLKGRQCGFFLLMHSRS